MKPLQMLADCFVHYCEEFMAYVLTAVSVTQDTHRSAGRLIDIQE
jgi:hypothetical protein